MRKDKYLKSESWKCTASPSGAHYWIEILDGKTRTLPEFRCHWCRATRQFPPVDGRRVYQDKVE